MFVYDVILVPKNMTFSEVGKLGAGLYLSKRLLFFYQKIDFEINVFSIVASP